MKKLVFGLPLLLSLSISTVQAAWYTVPSGFTLKSSSYGARLYEKNNGMSVVVVDTDKSSVTFNGYSNAGGGKFVNKTLNTHWSDAPSSTFAVINGQFYDSLSYSAKLAYPTKSQGVVLTYNNFDSLPKRSLRIDWSGNTYIHNGYSSGYIGSSTKELLVGLNPSVNKSKYDSIGRNYIGGIPKGNCNPNYSLCDNKYLIFLVAKHSTQAQAKSALQSWNVNNNSMVMMDGSGSAQMRVGNKSYYGSGFPVYRWFPHSIRISKW